MLTVLRTATPFRYVAKYHIQTALVNHNFSLIQLTRELTPEPLVETLYIYIN